MTNARPRGLRIWYNSNTQLKVSDYSGVNGLQVLIIQGQTTCKWLIRGE